MKTNDEIAIQMQGITRFLKRDPISINFIIEESKKSGFMRADLAMKLFNTYGLDAKNIYLLCFSHGLYLDLEGLFYAIEEHMDRIKNSKPCDKS